MMSTTDEVTFFLRYVRNRHSRWGGLESRSLILARRNMQLTRSRFSNIVLMSAKNFQFVKFSQADFGIKKSRRVIITALNGII